jgi:flagellar hook-associated protein 1 FlgK
MSISSLMSIGQTAMFASYAQIATTSNNISNANTPGYSEQQVQLASAAGQQTSAGFFGQGVDVATVTRTYNQFLTGQANATNSSSAADTASLTQLTQLESLFGTGTSGIGYAAGQLLNSFVDIANTPSDSSSRQVTLSKASQLASMFQSAGSQVSAIQSGIVQTVQTSLATVNGLATQVAALNKQIAAVQSSGQPPNDLLDQRDRLVNQIGNYVNVTTLPASDGTLSVFVGGGQSLVLGGSANALSTVADPYDASKVQVAVGAPGMALVTLPSSLISGGSIGGLLKVQNTDIPAANNLLGQMATAISSAMNQQQALGLDLSGKPGAPIFSVAAPQALPASTNTGNASIGITVSDATQVQASDYKLSFDGSNYSLTRLSDNTTAAGSPFTTAQLAAGVTVDGTTLQLNSGAASAGDSFVLRPVGRAAQTMQTVLVDPSGIAAAAPFVASTAAANRGTAAVASLTAVSTGYNPALTANINFTSNTGNYNWTLSDGTSGTGTWSAGNPIALNGFRLQLNGVPASGDAITVVPTASVGSNNGNAQAFFNMATTAIVAGQNVTNAYASVIANIGVRVQSATAASTASSAAAASAKTAAANNSGVNLDEEASRLIQFQQSYQAAAKVLQVAQSLFTSLLQSVGAG